MSATIGTLAALVMAGMAAVDSTSGQDTRTMSAPASSSWRIWSMVAAASAVSVLVIDCTEIGASPPTSTDPTRILREGRRWIMRQGRWEFGSADMGANIGAGRGKVDTGFPPATRPDFRILSAVRRSGHPAAAIAPNARTVAGKAHLACIVLRIKPLYFANGRQAA